MIRWFPAGVLAVTLACMVGRPAVAAWPDDRPIEIIVGFQAGSGPDILARRIAPVLASFVVNNRTGAAGEIALTALARAEPNGYTIGGLSTPSFIVVPLIKKPQYDPAAIVPLARVVDDPTLVVAGGASGIAGSEHLRDALQLPAGFAAGSGRICLRRRDGADRFG